MKKLSQKGIVQLLPLVLIIAVGAIAFILLAQTASFKDRLFGQLFPKPPSFAATCTSSSKNFEANLTGAQEVPATSSTATGAVYMFLDPADNTKLNYSIGTSGINASQITAIHIHSPAAAGATASPTVTLYDPSMGTISIPYNRTATLPANVLADILAGNAYVNVHTSANPNGEIRGQLTCSTSEAKYNFQAPTNLVSVGQQIAVDVMVRSDTDLSSTFDAKLNFDQTKLDVSSIDTNSSFVGLWVERLFSNSAGTVSLIGGVVNPGFQTSGSDQLLARINFTVKATGSAQISVDQNSSILRISDSMNILANQATTNVNDPASQKSASFSWQGSSSVTDGQQFTLNLMARSDVDAANLFAGKFFYPAQALEVVSIDTTGSFVTQWVEQFYDNTSGELSMIGGIPNPGFQTTGSDALMATVTFRAKSAQTATITADTGIAIYRNSDNVDIYDAGQDPSFTLTINPITASPSPSSSATATPTPTPTPTPSPSPSPVVSPSPSAAVSPSQSAQPSASPTACAISSANWISTRTPANLGDLITLRAVGNSLCTGQAVAFEIREDDGILAFDPINFAPQNATFLSDHTA